MVEPASAGTGLAADAQRPRPARERLLAVHVHPWRHGSAATRSAEPRRSRSLRSLTESLRFPSIPVDGSSPRRIRLTPPAQRSSRSPASRFQRSSISPGFGRWRSATAFTTRATWRTARPSSSHTEWRARFGGHHVRQRSNVASTGSDMSKSTTSPVDSQVMFAVPEVVHRPDAPNRPTDASHATRQPDREVGRKVKLWRSPWLPAST